MSVIDVESEIEPLKEVLLHRPGKELLNLTEDTLSKLLFDEIPCLEKAQKEHDSFAQKLKENGVKVVYLEDLMSEALINPQIKDKFIKQFIEEASVKSKYKIPTYNYLNSIKDIKKMVLTTMEGIKKEDITKLKSPFFITDPMPNLYFTRDNFSSLNDGISLNKMSSSTRSRETIYGEYIFNHHPKYKNKVTKYYNRYEKYHIEGGDIINLNSHTLLIGISQRTEMKAILTLANHIFQNKTKIDNVLAITIPKNRAFMHLDTIFTQVDYNKFVYYPKAFEKSEIYEINKTKVQKTNEKLKTVLEKYIHNEVTLIPCANGDLANGKKEQWDDGCNTLCINKGLVIVYDKNKITNESLKKHGIKVIEIKGSELLKGRGGPRCMSMPLIRK